MFGHHAQEHWREQEHGQDLWQSVSCSCLNSLPVPSYTNHVLLLMETQLSTVVQTVKPALCVMMALARVRVKVI